MDPKYKAQLVQIEASLQKDLQSVTTTSALQVIEGKYLGSKGEFNTLFKTIPNEEKKEAGQSFNQSKISAKEILATKLTQILNAPTNSNFDATIPGTLPSIGSVHLLTQAIEEIENIFKKLGFSRRRYPEVDTDWYYAEGLNIPKDHPARDDQETFYLTDNIVLTAHTSNGQLHEMEYKKVPPIKMINIGKTYRRQADATHSPMFHQFEGLVVDKNINITNLIGVTDFFAKSFFGQDRTTRLRPHHFQFTEPSFEIDISCDLCKGTGYIKKEKCKICKTGWLELGGAGMVHPNVLKNGGIDPEVYSGFAFGWGVERVLMMKTGLNLPDLRMLYGDDLRFLSQF